MKREPEGFTKFRGDGQRDRRLASSFGTILKFGSEDRLVWNMGRLGEVDEITCGQILSCFPFDALLGGVVNDGDNGDKKFSHFALALLATFNNAEGLLEEVAVGGVKGNA